MASLQLYYKKYMLLNIIIIIATIAGLWYGATWVVGSASNFAKKIGMSDLVIGLTVVAIATSAPEFAVTVSANLSGKSSISVANVIGSDIFNLGFILGIVAIFGVIEISKQLFYRDGLFLLFTGILLFIFFLDYRLSLFEGIILAGLLIAYLVFLAKLKRTLDEDIPYGEFRWYDVPKFLIGVGVIIFSAHYLVEASSEIAAALGVSDWLIGVTIVAAGTSAPELATSIAALVKGNHGMSIGNLIGSDLFNLLGVLGVAAILKPLTINQSELYNILILVGALLILLIMMRTKWKLSKTEGIILLLIALIRWSVDLII